MELNNVKYQFRFENKQVEIVNLRYIDVFSQSIVFKTEGLQNVIVSIYN